MKATNRSASDGDERERKNLARKHGPGAVHKPSERWHVQRGMQRHNADTEKPDRAQLHKGAEIIARRQQQPHWNCGSSESVDDDENRQSGRAKRENARHGVILRRPFATPDCEQKKKKKTTHKKTKNFFYTTTPTTNKTKKKT